jgi:hypothetical protein
LKRLPLKLKIPENIPAVLNMNKTKAVQIQLAGSRKETVKAKSAESTGTSRATGWERIARCHLSERAGGWQESREQNQ